MTVVFFLTERDRNRTYSSGKTPIGGDGFALSSNARAMSIGGEDEGKGRGGAVRDTYILEREGSASRIVRAGSDDERSG